MLLGKVQATKIYFVPVTQLEELVQLNEETFDLFHNAFRWMSFAGS